MKKNLIALAIILGSSAAGTTFAEELIEHRVTGPKDKRVNFLIVGDGFTAAERGKFLQGVANFHNALMVDSWGAYTNYFNTYAIFKASEQSGATRDDGVTIRNTLFNCNHSAKMVRLVVCDYKAVTAFKNRLFPEADHVVVISNSPKYGGSGGGISVATIGSPEIVAHEVGHSFVGLADEYTSTGGKPREAHNTTANILDRTQIKWAHWIEPYTPIKTPDLSIYHNDVGAFEGAAYMTTGWYRPTYKSRMRANGFPNGPVNDEQFVLAMYKRVSPIESFVPANTATIPWRGQGTLAVQPMRPDRHSLNVEWWVNGVRTFETGNVFQGSNLPYSGTATVTAKVIDRTAYVRKDTANLLEDEVSWTVQVGQATTPAPTLAPLPTATPRPTATATPLPTSTPRPTATATPRPTATATPLPTATPRPTATATPLPTATPRPTATATPLPTSTPRPTATTTPLPTATTRPTATATPLPTATPRPTATATPLPTATPRPTATATPLPTSTPRPTATATPLPTVTPRPTATATPLPIATPRPTATATPLPTATPRPTATATPLPTATPRPTATATSLPTATPRPTATGTPLPTSTARPTTPSAATGSVAALPVCAKPFDAKAKYGVGDIVSISSRNYEYVGWSYSTWRDVGKCKP